jgi:glycosyltransferase 2 family protein
LMLLVGATCLGWVAGFVFIPAPGGLGPRELVFTLLLGTNIRPGQAALFAVATRISFVVVDAAGAAAGALILRKPRTPARPNSPS